MAPPGQVPHLSVFEYTLATQTFAVFEEWEIGVHVCAPQFPVWGIILGAFGLRDLGPQLVVKSWPLFTAGKRSPYVGNYKPREKRCDEKRVDE
jgi:hypothetical protein